jgi:hypothetical protein
MSSNVINLFDVRRARASDTEDAVKPELQVQLDLPFGGMPVATAVAEPQTIVRAEVAEVVPRVADGGTSHTDKYMMLAFADDFPFQDDFLNFCKATTPNLVVDLRVAPRLDFVRPVRKQAFELFDMCGIEYRDVLGRLNATTYDLPQSRFEEVISAVESLLTSHHDGRPTLGLFDNPTFARFCTAKLSKAMPVMTLDSDAVRRMVADGARERM